MHCQNPISKNGINPIEILPENGLLPFIQLRVVKILWLAHRDPLNPRAGGAERTINEVGTRLVQRGHQVILLSGGWKGCKPIENLKGIEIRRFGKYLGPHLAAPIFLIKYRCDLVVNDLGHAVPWISSTIHKEFITIKNKIAFFYSCYYFRKQMVYLP